VHIWDETVQDGHGLMKGRAGQVWVRSLQLWVTFRRETVQGEHGLKRRAGQVWVRSL